MECIKIMELDLSVACEKLRHFDPYLYTGQDLCCNKLFFFCQIFLLVLLINCKKVKEKTGKANGRKE